MWISLILAVFAQASEDRGVHAWFLGPSDMEVRWCVEAKDSRRFKADGVERVLSEWTAYLKNIRLEGNLEPEIALNWKRGECDGRQDLTFYFGKGHPLVEPYRKQYRDPLGFAQLLEYNEEKGWGRGFVWMENDGDYHDWENFEGILTHEIGHVLGFGHVDGTIMEADLPGLFRRAREAIERKDYSLGGHAINFERELLFEAQSGFRFDDYVGYGSGEDVALVFERLTGIKAKEKVKVEFRLEAGIFGFAANLGLWETNMRPENQTWLEYFTTFTAEGAYRRRDHWFAIDLEPKPKQVITSQTKVMRKLFRGKEFYRQPFALTWAGTLTTPKESFPVLLQRNLTGALLEILIFIDGKPHRVFSQPTNQANIRPELY